MSSDDFYDVGQSGSFWPIPIPVAPPTNQYLSLRELVQLESWSFTSRVGPDRLAQSPDLKKTMEQEVGLAVNEAKLAIVQRLWPKATFSTPLDPYLHVDVKDGATDDGLKELAIWVTWRLPRDAKWDIAGQLYAIPDDQPYAVAAAPPSWSVLPSDTSSYSLFKPQITTYRRCGWDLTRCCWITEETP